MPVSATAAYLAAAAGKGNSLSSASRRCVPEGDSATTRSGRRPRWHPDRDRAACTGRRPPREPRLELRNGENDRAVVVGASEEGAARAVRLRLTLLILYEQSSAPGVPNAEAAEERRDRGRRPARRRIAVVLSSPARTTATVSARFSTAPPVGDGPLSAAVALPPPTGRATRAPRRRATVGTGRCAAGRQVERKMITRSNPQRAHRRRKPRARRGAPSRCAGGAADSTSTSGEVLSSLSPKRRERCPLVVEGRRHRRARELGAGVHLECAPASPSTTAAAQLRSHAAARGRASPPSPRTASRCATPRRRHQAASAGDDAQLAAGAGGDARRPAVTANVVTWMWYAARWRRRLPRAAGSRVRLEYPRCTSSPRLLLVDQCPSTLAGAPPTPSSLPPSSRRGGARASRSGAILPRGTLRRSRRSHFGPPTLMT